MDTDISKKWDKVNMITGPNSMYQFIYKDRTYTFFGDEHSGTGMGCKSQYPDIVEACDALIESFDAVKINGKKCTTIAAMLHLWFLYNNQEKIPTDFYLEIPFTKDPKRRTYEVLRQEIIRRRAGGKRDPNDDPLKDTSWMIILFLLMEPCFAANKELCPYSPYVKLHYADIRQYDLLKAHLPDPFIISDIVKSLILDLEYGKDPRLVLQEYIEIITLLITEAHSIIERIISPEGFDEFYKNLLSRKVSKRFTEKIEDMRYMTVVRNGVKMHRAAAQFWKLRKTNPEMAKMIHDFILNNADIYAAKAFEASDESFTSAQEMGYNASALDVYAYNTKGTDYLEQYLLPLSALSMDAYILARMMRRPESKGYSL